jgi:hypothetical protein
MKANSLESTAWLAPEIQIQHETSKKTKQKTNKQKHTKKQNKTKQNKKPQIITECKTFA